MLGLSPVGAYPSELHTRNADYGVAGEILMGRLRVTLGGLGLLVALGYAGAAQPSEPSLCLTSPAKAQPRINGPTVFGVRPGSPLLYGIPATGERPIEFSVERLPRGLTVDPATGRISGTLKKAGVYKVVLRAKNALGSACKPFRIVVGERICLTPPLGWNSWNCWAAAVDQDKVLRSARAMVKSGLINHGWTYVNIDDTWQGRRGGPFHGIQANRKFPDMNGLCDAIHAMGLKAGIYSTPWITSYAKFAGGSSDDPAGVWSEKLADDQFWRHGKYPFAAQDARQWAAWGFDYLKYDWNPNDVPHVEEMSKALRQSGRDIVYSLSNSAPLAHATDWARLANCWRTTGDIWDYWDYSDHDWRYGVSEIAFSQDAWTPYAGPGHWNDPDMLVVGHVGWGPQLHATKLTPDEQYSHISMWCLLSAPLLIGCDMERLDRFALNLLTNDEVLAVDQDALGRQAKHAAALGALDVFVKDLEDGSKAVGFFNRGDKSQTFVFNKLSKLGIAGKHHLRDLWRQKDLPDVAGTVEVNAGPHGVVLLRFSPADR
jgi:alpha-galactosidase